MSVASKYRSKGGRVFLAGDSAHQTIPIGGYDTSTGLGDGYDIAWKLAAVINVFRGEELLCSYEIERKPVAERNVLRGALHMGFHRTRSDWAQRASNPSLVTSDSEEGLSCALGWTTNTPRHWSLSQSWKVTQKNRNRTQKSTESSSTLPNSTSDDVHLRPAIVPIPALYPLYLPYKTQRRILSAVQLKSEECCFEFAQKWLPDMVAAEGWEFAEQMQLSEWTMKIHKQRKTLPGAAITLNKSEEMFEKTLFATHKLEEPAVHRSRICATRVAELVEDALAQVIMLKDTARARRIEQIGKRVRTSREGMEDKKRGLKNTLTSELDSIGMRRAELDLLEKIAVERMVKDDKNNHLAAGLALDEILDQDEADVKNSGFQENQGQEKFESTAFDGGVSKRTIESSDTKRIANIPGGPTAKFRTVVAPVKSITCRSHASAELSVSAINKKSSSGTEPSAAPSSTRSTDTSQLSKGPLFTLQLSDSIHNPIVQSTSVHDNFDFSKFALDDINACKAIRDLEFFKNGTRAFEFYRPSQPHTQLLNPCYSDASIPQSAVSTESNVNVSNSASVAFRFSKPSSPYYNTSNPRRNIFRPRRKQLEIIPDSSSDCFDIATIIDDEIT
ncbi:hypothetical protein MMC22_006309 [Lobaria immixta]|nr:hypothetical protein [Lobaria immixta]